MLDFHRDDSVLALLEVRRILGPAATAMAAQRMTNGNSLRMRSNAGLIARAAKRKA